MSRSEVIVSIALDNENIHVGRLWFHTRKKRESASFEYDKAWLLHPEKFALEPALTLTEGAHHTDQRVFGAIGDSAPDRWGRLLMRRWAAIQDKEDQTTPRTLMELDYLLGVNDEVRQGALRFSQAPQNEVFLAQNDGQCIPPLIELPKLLSASERLFANDENAADLKLLLAPGSSLGGARPKAAVRDKDNSLCIAKFPRKDDEFCLVLWEAVALRLAQNAGLDVPQWRVETVLGKPVLIIRRFDRYNNLRIPFLSAMSMLGAQDHEPHSYLEIADALIQHGAAPGRDMQELWRRIVFSIMIANTDDHLRNHGFLYERAKGWRLAPLYDVNPTPLELKPRVLTTAIDLEDCTGSIDLALSVAKDFRLTLQRAQEIVTEVSLAVAKWSDIAMHLGLSKREKDQMASAFNSNV